MNNPLDRRDDSARRIARDAEAARIRRIAARAIGLNPDGPLGRRIAARIRV